MMNIKNKIRNKLKKFLGIEKLSEDFLKQIDKERFRITKLEELSLIGVDLSTIEEEQTYIVIASRLNGGVVKIIPTRFASYSDFKRFMTEMEYSLRINNVIVDKPKYLYEF